MFDFLAQAQPIDPSELIDFGGTATNVLAILGTAFVAAAGVILAVVIAKKSLGWFSRG